MRHSETSSASRALGRTFQKMLFFTLHLRWIWGNISFDKTHGRSVITSHHNVLGTQPDTSACLSRSPLACKLAGFCRTARQPVSAPPESLHTSHFVWTFVVEGIILAGSLSGIRITSASRIRIYVSAMQAIFKGCKHF